MVASELGRIIIVFFPLRFFMIMLMKILADKEGDHETERIDRAQYIHFHSSIANY